MDGRLIGQTELILMSPISDLGGGLGDKNEQLQSSEYIDNVGKILFNKTIKIKGIIFI